MGLSSIALAVGIGAARKLAGEGGQQGGAGQLVNGNGPYTYGGVSAAEKGFQVLLPSRREDKLRAPRAFPEPSWTMP